MRLVAFTLLLCAGTSLAAPNPDNAARLEQLRRQVLAIQKEIANSEETRAEAADQLAKSERAISEANRRLFEIAREQQSNRATLTRINAEQAALDRQIGAQQALLERLILQHYLGGRNEPFRLALSGRSPHELPRLFYYYKRINEARADLVTQLRGRLLRSQALATEAQGEMARLGALESEARGEREKLEVEKRAHAEALKKISRQIAARRRELSALQKDEQRLTRLAERLARLLRPTPAAPRTNGAEPTSGAFLQFKGRLPAPVQGELANRFGSQRVEGGLTWKGLFYRAAAGQPVRAVAAGQVVFADWLRGFGNLLIIDHGEGFMSLYGNAEALLQRVGAAVAAGEVVAQAGDTGGLGQTGLYFELRHQGRAFDPQAWLTK